MKHSKGKQVVPVNYPIVVADQTAIFQLNTTTKRDNMKQKTWEFSALLDGWQIVQLERKGHTETQARKRLRRKFGRRITNLRLAGWKES